VVSEIFWPEGGGAELATYLILRILHRAGCKITVVTGTENPIVVDGVKFYYTRLLGHWNRIKRFLGTWLLTKEEWFLRLLKEHDLLYIPLLAYPLIPLAKRLGLHTVVHLHNYSPIRYHGTKYFFEPDSLNALEEVRIAVFHEHHTNKSILRTIMLPTSYLIYRMSKEWLKETDLIICVSKRQWEIVKQQIPNTKIEVVYNPPPPMPHIKKQLSEIPTVIYIGGDDYLKGFPIALWIFKRLQKNFKAYIAGRVPTRWIRALKRANKQDNKIILLGKVPHRNILRLHNQMWIHLFPSIVEEPLPYAVVEASIAGTVTVAFKVGGVPEIVEKTPAEEFLCEPGNVNCLVEKLEYLLSLKPNDITELSLKIKEDVAKKFNSDIIEEKVVNLLGTDVA